MSRTARASPGGFCYHVLNRGNDRRTVFHKEGAFAAFVQLRRQAGEPTHACLEYGNTPPSEAEVERLREYLRRGRPFGASPWMAEVARQLGLEASLRPRGRPRKAPQGVALRGG